jgi:hypothetical protein
MHETKIPNPIRILFANDIEVSACQTPFLHQEGINSAEMTRWSRAILFRCMDCMRFAYVACTMCMRCRHAKWPLECIRRMQDKGGCSAFKKCMRGMHRACGECIKFYRACGVIRFPPNGILPPGFTPCQNSCIFQSPLSVAVNAARTQTGLYMRRAHADFDACTTCIRRMHQKDSSFRNCRLAYADFPEDAQWLFPDTLLQLV